MGHTKLKCKSKTNNGLPCNNWAVKGSYFCQLHQNQMTPVDVKDTRNTQFISCPVIIGIVIIIFLISKAAGCEDQIFKWLNAKLR